MFSRAKYYRNRYRHEDEFRRKSIAASIKWQNKQRANPVWLRLVYVRKRVCQVREGLDALMQRVERREKLLLALIAERDGLHRRWKAEKRQ
jgi:hypothetical protein